MISTTARLFSARASRVASARAASSWSVDNPYTGEVYAEGALSDRSAAYAQIDRSATVQRECATTSLEERVALSGRFIDAFEAYPERIAMYITRQMGKTLSMANGEITGM